jgi:Cu(I)/Ag(I) efflux system membrane fusion protein
MKPLRKIVIIILVVLLAATGGYFLWRHDHGTETGPAGAKVAQQAVQYTCPMHPFIVTDKPGACPVCGMTLVKKIEAPPETGQTAATESISMTAAQQLMANVATAKVNRQSLTREITAVGIVQYDQARQAKVTAWVAGRIERLYVNTVGAYVSKGRPVAEVYSPDLVSAQQEYLLALRSRDQLKDSTIHAISHGGEGLVASARQRLKLLGVRDDQIAGLEKTGQPNIRLAIYTPLSGIVIDKNVQEGQYVNVGDPLFSIADLSRVWAELELYENEFPFIRVGQTVQIVSQSYPDTTFTGRVSFIYPFLDPKTRTVKVRVELANRGLRLKPDMFVNATVRVPLGEALVVPVTAVMDTGVRKVVWVEARPGLFEQREVKVGARSGEHLQILAGLTRGDRVAVSGGYLVDSESQLRGGGANGGHAGHSGGQHGSPAPAGPAKGGDMNMDDMKR